MLVHSISNTNFNINAADAAANNNSSNNSAIEEYYTSDIEDYNAQFQEYIPAEPNSDIESDPEPNTPAGSWLEVVNHPDYEIFSEFPHDIRRKNTGRVVSKNINSKGYIQVELNGKSYLLHRIIAEQFIENPNPARLTVVDHIDRDKTNYRISNLRWTNQSQNCRNKSSHKGVVYSYIDMIAEDCIVVDHYGNHVLQNYDYDENLDQFFWHDVELARYRELPVLTLKNGTRYVCAVDSEGKQVAIRIHIFKQLYNLE